MIEKIAAKCALFKPISLKDMDAANFMDRIESKYSIHRDLLPSVLKKISKDYFILQIDNLRIFPYSTLYYDTENNLLYKSHHMGKLLRYKIRYRKYLACDLSFLEIKQKTTGDRTVKNRIRIDDIETSLSERARLYIDENTPFQNTSLEPKIYTNFSRITLVSTAINERATIDINIHFEFNGIDHSFDNLVIIEVKKNTHSSSSSSLIKTLRHFRVVPDGISKYCIGRAMIEKDLKSNNFRQGIKTINKINDGKYYYINFGQH
jgi:hypothetical protein